MYIIFLLYFIIINISISYNAYQANTYICVCDDESVRSFFLYFIYI